ncbi:hypothetical protein LIER_38128 [Lithospermum erythrorhizon]|uniref:Uncharacterized protein n=1 Tax=Lithospermum erythrorhizon TaxID=34254 RepID=A0AAV3PV44_LITER
MGKKMKGVVGYGDANISLKHQNLLQDYRELERETDSMKTKLEVAKQKKRSLLAEVSFLRRRYKYLSTVKSANHLKEQELVARVSGSQKKLSSQNRISKKRGAHLHQLPPLPYSNPRRSLCSGKEAVATLDLNHRQIVHIGIEDGQHNNSRLSEFKNKRRVNNASKKSILSQVAPLIDLNLGKEAQQHNKSQSNKRKLNSSKKAAFSNEVQVIDLNRTDRMHIKNDVAVLNTAPLLDLNQDSSLSGREASFSSGTPIFDLNEISTAEEDIQSNSAPLEELKKSLMRAGNDDHFNQDLKLSMCRDSGEGPSQVGKQKISWQDPVALRV